jgi:hypothetical protein
MIGLHHVFRDALAAAPELVGAAPAGNEARSEHVGTYYDNVLRLLHAHHEGEDELLTPLLVQRCPDEADVVQRISHQHVEVLGVMGVAESRLAAWRADPSADNRQSTTTALAALEVALTQHLDEEEREILPLAARCVNVAEWGQMPEHGMKIFTGDKVWLILGLIQDYMTPEHRAIMQTHMPPPVLEFWTNQGQPMYTEFMAELRA